MPFLANIIRSRSFIYKSKLIQIILNLQEEDNILKHLRSITIPNNNASNINLTKLYLIFRNKFRQKLINAT